MNIEIKVRFNVEDYWKETIDLVLVFMLNLHTYNHVMYFKHHNFVATPITLEITSFVCEEV